MIKKTVTNIKITKRADGRYMARYTNEKQGLKKTVYGKSEQGVREKLNKLDSEIQQGTYIEPHKQTVTEWLRCWLSDYAKISVKQSTYISYEGYIRNHCAPYFEKKLLVALGNEDLQRFFALKSEKLSPKTLRNIYNMLHVAFEQAVVNRRIQYDPIIGVRLPKQDKQEMRVLNRQEQDALVQQLALSDTLSDFGITFALNTGVRLGELLALRWEDINEEKKTITVRRSLARLNRVDEKGNVLLDLEVSAPVIKCKKTAIKKCRFVVMV